MKIQLDSRFKKRTQGLFGKYQFTVGVLEDKPYKIPKRGARGQRGRDVLKSYAGGPARQVTHRKSGQTLADISEANRKRMGVNYLTEPFKRRSSDIIRFTDSFFRLVFGRGQKKRAENLLQAVVRNPILRGDYGPNSKLTITIKGFNRYMIDTAQLFRALRAKCEVRRR